MIRRDWHALLEMVASLPASLSCRRLYGDNQRMVRARQCNNPSDYALIISLRTVPGYALTASSYHVSCTLYVVPCVVVTQQPKMKAELSSNECTAYDQPPFKINTVR